MKSIIRAFIAIELPLEIHQKLGEISTALQHKLEGMPIRWVHPDNIHLTLKFLGDVSVAQLEALQKMLETEVSGHSEFEIGIGELGAYPNPRRPHVIWIGVKAPLELRNVQYGIETQMERLGYGREERPFSPHLTLGRVARQASSSETRKIGDILNTNKVGFLGSTRVKSIHLFKSELRPGGAIYTRIFTARLGNFG